MTMLLINFWMHARHDVSLKHKNYIKNNSISNSPLNRCLRIGTNRTWNQMRKKLLSLGKIWAMEGQERRAQNYKAAIK